MRCLSVGVLDKILSVAGNDTIQVFGPSGSGKTTFANYVAMEAAKQGRKVVYIDSERNVNQKSDSDNFIYFYSPSLNDIINRCANLPPANLYVLDSIGFPVLSQFSLADMKRRGDMLLKCVTLTHYLKLATYKHKAVAIVTNQPQSQFGKTAGLDDLQPFGDKSMYGYKEIWRTYLDKASSDETICLIRAWRSRKFGRGKTLFQIRIADNKIDVKSLI